MVHIWGDLVARSEAPNTGSINYTTCIVHLPEAGSGTGVQPGAIVPGVPAQPIHIPFGKPADMLDVSSRSSSGSQHGLTQGGMKLKSLSGPSKQFSRIFCLTGQSDLVVVRNP